MDELQGNIDGKTFETNYTRAIASILDNAPDTHLFATGYPRFWNDETDYCDTVSFAFGCLTNSIVPLIKARRKRMNQLTFRLNDRIKSIIAEFPKKGSPITFVDTDSYFKDHRFCEEGVKEPSYRNRNIWFFPFEYWAPDKMPVTATKQTPSGDCKAILDIGGDAGSYFTCELTKSVATGTQIDLKDQPNNVKSDDEPPIPDASALPIFLSRIFHPTPDGHKAYQEAFFSAYKAYKDDKAPNSGHKSGVKCRGLQDNSYFTRATISDLITNTYCPKLAGMSETIGSGFYLPHTPEEIEIYAAPSWNSAKSMTTPEQCTKNLHKILDECDTDSSSNPMGWKAGGEVEADGWTYSIMAKDVRPPAPKRPSAWCQFEKCNAKTVCTVRLWGAGWLNSGFGHELREAFERQQAIWCMPATQNDLDKHAGIDVSSWGEMFNYEAVDKHEWTVTFGADTPLKLKFQDIVLQKMKTIANDKDPNFLDVGNCVFAG
jgi:hypothetical protein